MYKSKFNILFHCWCGNSMLSTYLIFNQNLFPWFQPLTSATLTSSQQARPIEKPKSIEKLTLNKHLINLEEAKENGGSLVKGRPTSHT